MSVRQMCVIALFTNALAAACLQVEAVAAISTSNIATLPSPDGHNITTDSITGLDWLDPAVTLGKSFSTVSALLQNDPLYADFRFATRGEVIGFLANLPTPVAANSSPYAILSTPDSGASAVALFAYTGTTAGGNTVRAITADVANPNVHYVYSISHANGPTETTGGLTNISNFVGSSTTGSWLVRDTPAAVPEPASIVIWGLLASGIATGIYGRRRSAAVGAFK